MGYKKQLLLCFFYLWAVISDSTDGLESKSLNKYKKIDLNTKIESECICLEKSPFQKTMSQLLDPTKKGLERLLIFLYKDSSGRIQLFIPGQEKQATIPDLQVESNDLSVLVTTNVTFESLFHNKDRVLKIHPFESENVTGPNLNKEDNIPSFDTFDTDTSSTSPSVQTTTESFEEGIPSWPDFDIPIEDIPPAEIEAEPSENIPYDTVVLQPSTESYVDGLILPVNIENSTTCCNHEPSNSKAKETNIPVQEYPFPYVKHTKIIIRTKNKHKIKGSLTNIYNYTFLDKNEKNKLNQDILDQLNGKDKIKVILPAYNKYGNKSSKIAGYKPYNDGKISKEHIIHEPFYNKTSTYFPNPTLKPLPIDENQVNAFVSKPVAVPVKDNSKETSLDQLNHPDPNVIASLPIEDSNEKIPNKINAPIPIYNDSTSNQLFEVATPYSNDGFYEEILNNQESDSNPKVIAPFLPKEDIEPISFDQVNTPIHNGTQQVPFEETFELPDGNDIDNQENLINKLIYSQPSHLETNPMISDLTFSEWFAKQMKNMESKTSLHTSIDTHTLEVLIKKSLMEHGLYVSSNGKLTDSKGQLLNMSNLHIRPLLIGETLEYDKLVASQLTNFVLPRNLPYLESLLITLLYPPKIIGIIPMGKIYLPTSLSQPIVIPNSNVQTETTEFGGPNLSVAQSIKYVSPKTQSKHIKISLIGKTSRKSNPNLSRAFFKEEKFGKAYFNRGGKPKNKTDEHAKELISEKGSTKNNQSLFDSIEPNLSRPEYSLSNDNPDEVTTPQQPDPVTESVEVSTEQEDKYFEEEINNNTFENNEIMQNDSPLKGNRLLKKEKLDILPMKTKKVIIKPKANKKQKLNDLKKVRKTLLQLLQLLRGNKPLPPKNEGEEDLDTFDPEFRIIGGAAATGSGSPISSRGRSGLLTAY